MHFFRTYIFYMGGYVPDMAKRIGEGAAAVAVEHIFQSANLGCASGDGFGEDSVYVRHIQIKTYGRAANGLRAAA